MLLLKEVAKKNGNFQKLKQQVNLLMPKIQEAQKQDQLEDNLENHQTKNLQVENQIEDLQAESLHQENQQVKNLQVENQ